MSEWKNKLYYGDNLEWLRNLDVFPSESVDLIYLDPPFNSKANYNVIFTEPGGQKKSQAQVQAFDDSWHWEKEAAVSALDELTASHPEIRDFIEWVGRRGDKKSTSTAAYLSMMAVRLLELHRVLKPTGSLYLHCDPTASHYLKALLDSIFGADNFRNEIIWRRTNAKGLAFTRFASNHDVILRYSKSEKSTWNPQYTEHNPEYIENFYRFVEEGTGRKYQLADLTNPNKNRPNLTYEFLGVTRVWRWPKERMQEAHKAGLIVQNTPGSIPRLKRYLDEQEGNAIGDTWDDILPVQSQASERLGYDTQKPLALMERIIQASSNEGDVVLDPFCGCGTAVAAAQKLNRKWLGIDVTWLAIDLIEKRLENAFGKAIKSTYIVKGQPVDEASTAALARKNKKEFEVWAISLVGAQSRERDGGVDGIFGFTEHDRKQRKILVQVKGGDMLNPGMVRDLIGTVKKEGAAIGLMITLRKPTPGMMTDAAHSDKYHSELWDKDYPSIQIRTVGELLAGNGFNLPTTENPMKKAGRVRKVGRTERML
ncbi:MAG: restriction endonuclease [Dehalococcoidia bacterium]|nr:restriction endonuclease [Dehalococcoidia bacterium]